MRPHLQSVKATFEKRGKVLRVWVEPVENPNPDAEPPVVELQLSLTNIVHGKPSKGPYAIHTENPCKPPLYSVLYFPSLTTGSVFYSSRVDQVQA